METQLISLSCDDLYISLVLESIDIEIDAEDNLNAVSDSKYAEGLQLQEAIMSSLIARQGQISPKSNRDGGSSSTKLTGESSQTLCEICAERKDANQMFPVQNCTHQFCTECICKHISTIVQNRNVILNHDKAPLLSCPGLDCKGFLEIETCREIVTEDVRRVWDDALYEALIDPSDRFYCPYKDCSALMVKECGDETREAECVRCNRLFCFQCNVPWHSGFVCEEFMKLGKNERGKGDLMVHDLAKQKKWQRCPSCKYYVEKTDGCLHITCRCGNQFCYACGSAWTPDHNCRR